MTFLSHLDWRNATKAFDTQQKISPEDLQKILDAIRMSPSSYGLQSYHVYVLQNQDLQDKIQAISWNQPQVGTASHLLIFSARKDVESRIGQYMDIALQQNPENKEGLKAYEELMKNNLLDLTSGEELTWAEKQSYIALGFAMAACAELEIDSCPMEGCDFTALDALLDTPDHLESCVMLPIGYRVDNPRPKVRFSQEDLFTILKS